MEALQRRVGTMSATNSPSQTPRSGEKFSREFRPGDRDKGVNIQVILRCRPLSDEESKSRSAAVITCSEARREVSASLSIANKQIDRTFTFDKVFGPTSKQKDLFELAVAPVVNEVLEGYNCTIFAYGQTGTGKTYTMEGGGGGGGRKIKKGELPSDAGVIPRSVQRIFRILDAQDAEYSVKVSFLELYNEEITDLLAPEELRFSLAAAAEDKSRKPIALMEDGKGGVLVRGLEEEIVCSADEIYKILDKGSAKRRTAETLLNKQSSRSHSIFTITIHIKERTPEGEELIKCGKLNLVDLAGSENISRSGARDGRAREAGEINKSLLTLGRVINSLVEHSGHVPYRESKLTRLLRDSLGGKTKTCIIATIAPSVHCLEETLSTLDYAHRAKHIKNKPEINQRMMKSEMIKDLYSEIDRLKQEVYAAREKNGIYIPAERYVQEEAEKKAMAEKLERLEIDLDAKDKQLAEVHDLYNSEKVLSAGLGNKLNKTKNQLASTQNDLHAMEERHKQALATIKEKEYFICNLQKSEKALLDRAFELRSELQQAVSDISGLFSKIERKDIIEDRNKFVVDQFQTQLNQQLDLLHRTVSISVLQQENQIREMEETMQAFVAKKSENTEELRQQVGKLKAMHTSGLGDLDGLAEELSSMSNVGFTKMNTQASAHSSAVEDCFTRISVEADQLFSALQTSLASQKTKLAAFAQTQHESHDKAIEWTRLISTVTSNFFKDFDMHTSKMSTIIEETQTQQDQKLCDLQKNFEECAANEERQIMEKVAEMLASSTLRKKMLVQLAVDGLRETAADRTKKIQEEMCSGEALKSSIKRHWTKHTEESEDHYHHTISLVQQGHVSLGEGLQQCVDKTKLAVMQWKNAKDSVLDLEKENVTSVESIARNGTKESNVLQQRLSTAASAVLADTDSSTNDILALVDENLQLDREACTNISIKTSPCCKELRELKTGHQNKTTEIKGCTQKCFFDDYQVDKPSCCTPRRRPMTLPSESCIRELQTPTFEELLKSYSTEVKIVCELANAGGVKQFPGETDAQRDSRTPFSTIN